MIRLSLKNAFYALITLGLVAVTGTCWACGQNATTITALPTLGGAATEPHGLNHGSLITGYSYTPSNQSAHAFLFKQGQMLDLATLGGSVSIGHAVNSTGVVAGESDLPGDAQTHACLHAGSGWLDLGTLGGSYSMASAVNDSDQAAGISYLAGDSSIQGFCYSNGRMQSVGSLGSGYSDAIAISRNGAVIGDSLTADYENHAYIYANGEITDLGTFGGGYSSAYAVNSSDVVVGESATLAGQAHAFSWQKGLLADLGTLGGGDSSARALNDSGQIIGLSSTANRQTHGFIFQNGIMQDLGTLGGGFCQPYAINNAGQVVGESSTSSGRNHAFLWQNGNLLDLNTSLPAGSGWELTSARFINDDGGILGEGYYNGTAQWFLLQPGSANQPPLAVAGPDQTVSCEASTTLDGTRSTDPDHDVLQFEWSLGDTALGTNSVLVVSLPQGTNVIALKVTDPCGASSQASVTVYVLDLTQPTVFCPETGNVAADANCQAPVPNLIPNLVLGDDCTPVEMLKVTQEPAPGTLVSVGTHRIAFTAVDNAGNTATYISMLAVRDIAEPQIRSANATPAVLSPPNHQLVLVTVSVHVSDSCDSAPVSRIVSITCDETPAPGEIQITGDLTAMLAATKNASGDARVYTIHVETKDASGNTSTASVPVSVPKSNGRVAPSKGSKRV